MTSFFYVVSSACNTSVPAFRKCMDASIKKIFWLRSQPLVHRLLDLFVGPERLASHPPFERSKHMKITGGEFCRVWRMWKTLEGQILDCCNSRTGSMGPSFVMLQQNTCTQTSTYNFPVHIHFMLNRLRMPRFLKQLAPLIFHRLTYCV